MDPGVAGALEGDADRVVEVAGGGLVVADEAGEDRQPGGVGRGPALGAAGGGAQVPVGPRVGVPVRPRLGDVEGAVELVELAGGAVDDEHVAVAVAAVAALDRRVRPGPGTARGRSRRRRRCSGSAACAARRRRPSRGSRRGAASRSRDAGCRRRGSRCRRCRRSSAGPAAPSRCPGSRPPRWRAKARAGRAKPAGPGRPDRSRGRGKGRRQRPRRPGRRRDRKRRGRPARPRSRFLPQPGGENGGSGSRRRAAAQASLASDEPGRASDPAGDSARALGGAAPDPRRLPGAPRADGETARGPAAARPRRGRRCRLHGRADERRRGGALPGARRRAEWLAEAVERGMPVLGICLGAQLLARALGAEVRPGAAPEIGFAPGRGHRPATTRCSAGSRPRAEVLHWHGDVFDLPDGRRAPRLLGAHRVPGLPRRQRLGRPLPSRGGLRPGRGLARGAGDDRPRRWRRSATTGEHALPRARRRAGGGRWSRGPRRASRPSLKSSPPGRGRRDGGLPDGRGPGGRDLGGLAGAGGGLRRARGGDDVPLRPLPLGRRPARARLARCLGDDRRARRRHREAAAGDDGLAGDLPPSRACWRSWR